MSETLVVTTEEMRVFLKTILRAGKRCVYLILKIVALGLRTKKGLWVIGGERDREVEGNSIGFYRFLQEKHPELDVVFICKKRRNVAMLSARGVSACFNYSLSGLWHAMRAEVYCYSIYPGDVDMVSPAHTLFVNLFHGAALKKIIYDAESSTLVPASCPTKRVWYDPAVPYCEVDLVITTSDFLVPYMKSAFRTYRVEPLGLPRNDILLREASDVARIAAIKGRLRCGGKRIVTYMPTHRSYGAAVPPVLFLGLADRIQRELGDDVVVVTKQHPRTPVIPGAPLGESVFCLDHGFLETEELLLVTDVLITDYSSVFVDFLLLNRPVLFYCYDLDKIQMDDFYFFGEELLPGKIYQTEETLWPALKGILLDPRAAIQRSVDCRSRYHKYPDGMSSGRIHNRILQLLSERK